MEETLNQAAVNPLLDRLRMPGSTFRLPSQGLFYADGELADGVKNGEVEVYPMTAMEEIILNTPDKLLSGKAITEVFGRCIPQILKPGDLLAKDVDYLMVSLRQVSFGNDMEIVYTHTCEHAKMQTYKVDLQKMLNRAKQVDPTMINQEYTHTCQNGQVVTLKPLTYGNLIELYQTTAINKSDDISQDEAEALVINTLASVIRKVDDVTDKANIREWVTKIPLGWKKDIEKAAQSVTTWGIDFITTQRCKDCKATIDITVTANPVSFFS